MAVLVDSYIPASSSSLHLRAADLAALDVVRAVPSSETSKGFSAAAVAIKWPFKPASTTRRLGCSSSRLQMVKVDSSVHLGAASMTTTAPGMYSMSPRMLDTEREHGVSKLRASGTKRARSANDVDGEMTSNMSSKKRRLRRRLITSRLSRPYSAPATHILDRRPTPITKQRFLERETPSRMRSMLVSRLGVLPLTKDRRSAGLISSARGPDSVSSATDSCQLPLPETLRRVAILNLMRLRDAQVVSCRPFSRRLHESTSRGWEKTNNVKTFTADEVLKTPAGASSPYIRTMSRIVAPLITEECYTDDDQPSFPPGMQPFLNDDSDHDGYDSDELPIDFETVFAKHDSSDWDDASLDYSFSSPRILDGSADLGRRATSALLTSHSILPGLSTRSSPRTAQSQRSSGEVLEEVMDNVDGIPATSRKKFWVIDDTLPSKRT